MQFDVSPFLLIKSSEAIRVDSLFAVYQLNQSEQL
jgi:hypothetical protein